jgi:hypothetical protein
LQKKKRIEKAILALRENKFVKYDHLEYRERKIGIFLGCIPQQQANLPEQKNLSPKRVHIKTAKTQWSFDARRSSNEGRTNDTIGCK